MQLPPLSFTDLSLLLATSAVMLLVTLEVASPYFGRTNLMINRHRLKVVAGVVSILFLITFAITTYNLLSGL